MRDAYKSYKKKRKESKNRKNPKIMPMSGDVPMDEGKLRSDKLREEWRRFVDDLVKKGFSEEEIKDVSPRLVQKFEDELDRSPPKYSPRYSLSSSSNPPAPPPPPPRYDSPNERPTIKRLTSKQKERLNQLKHKDYLSNHQIDEFLDTSQSVEGKKSPYQSPVQIRNPLKKPRPRRPSVKPPSKRRPTVYRMRGGSKRTKRKTKKPKKSKKRTKRKTKKSTKKIVRRPKPIINNRTKIDGRCACKCGYSTRVNSVYSKRPLECYYHSRWKRSKKRKTKKRTKRKTKSSKRK